MSGRGPRPDAGYEDLKLAEQFEGERRRPEIGGTPIPADAAALLGGILVSEDEVLHGAPGLDEETQRKAVVRLRQHFNRHGCTRVKPDDPPCQHRYHYRDVALLRGTLMKLGLSGDVSLLAPPERRSVQRLITGLTVAQVTQLVRDERIPANATFDAVDSDNAPLMLEPVLRWEVEGDDGG